MRWIVGAVLLLLLAAPERTSAQVPARVAVPYTLMDAESRTYVRLSASIRV